MAELDSHNDIDPIHELNVSSCNITFELERQVRTNDNRSISVNTISQSFPTLTIKYPELIDQTSTNLSHGIYTFPNDYALACYLYVVEPMRTSISELSVSMTESDIKYLSQKNKNKKKKKKSSEGENHFVVVSEPTKVKIKDVSEGENLSEVPKDEIFDVLLSHLQDRSLVLIEPTQSINLGTIEEPQLVHVTQSLSEEEK